MKNLFKINLRQFDSLTVINKTTSNTTGNDLTAEMKTFYEKTLLEAARPSLVHQQFGKKVSIPARNGRTVEFRKFSSLKKALTPLTEGVTPDGDTLNVEPVVAACYQYGNYVTLSDLLELEAIDPIIANTTKEIGENAALTLDTVTRNELQAGTNVMYAPNSQGVVPSSRADITSDNKVTSKVVLKATTKMRKNNVPTIDGDYVWIIHPSVEEDVMSDEKWIEVQKYTDNVKKVYSGEIGRLYNMRFVRTTEAKIYQAGTELAPNAVYGNLVLGKDGYGVVDVAGGIEVIVKQKGSAGSNDPLNQRSTIGWKINGFCAKILQQERVLRVESGSSYSAEDEAN